MRNIQILRLIYVNNIEQKGLIYYNDIKDFLSSVKNYLQVINSRAFKNR